MFRCFRLFIDVLQYRLQKFRNGRKKTNIGNIHIVSKVQIFALYTSLCRKTLNRNIEGNNAKCTFYIRDRNLELAIPFFYGALIKNKRECNGNKI